MAKDKHIYAGVTVRIDGKEIPNNARAIRAEMKKVRESIDGMTRGSEEYIRATKKYQQLDGILQHHRAQLKAVEVQQKSMLQRGVAFFRDYSLQITGAIAAITGVAMELNKFRKQAAEKEDAAANLKALTGLDDANIAWLTKQAEILSTTMEKSGLRVRKSATEILEAYMLVGSKKPELLQDKEALNAVTIEAMRLAEAAKMELKDAVEGLTLAMNQYGASADEASRYVNVLAAGSKYGAVGVATQTESIVKAGVAASTAKVPIEQLVGVLETLGEKGIESSIAGTQLKTVFLKLESGAEDTRPSVVGLQTALERLAAKNLDVTEMTKMFGLESITTAKALIDSADKVKYYTDAVTGTNVATEQAAINSDTTAARMAQVRNQINLTGQELAKTLAPIMSKTVGWTRKFVMMLPGLIDFLKKWGIQLAILAAAYSALAIKNALATAAQTSWNATVSFGKGIAGGFRAMLILLHAGYTLLTKGMTAAKIEMTALNAAMKANAFGIIVTAGVLLYEVITRLINRTRQLTKEQRVQRQMARDIADAEREGNRQRAEAETKVKQLNAVVHDNTRKLSDRRIALQELKKLVPGYHAELTTEGRLIKDNTTALKDYLDNLKQVAVQQALQSKMTALVEAELNQQDSRRRRANAERIRRDRLSAFDAEHADIKQFMEKGMSANYGGGYEFVSEWMKKNDVGRLTAQRQIGQLLKQRQQLLDSINEAQSWVTEADDALDNIQRRQENLQKQGADIVKSLPNSQTTPEATVPDASPSGSSPAVTPETESERQKRIRKAIAAVDAEYDAKANDAKRQYLDGEIATEQEYSQRLQDIELQRLDAKLKIAGLEPEQREQLQQKILDMKMKLMEQLRTLDNLETENEQNSLQRQLDANAEAEVKRMAILENAKAAGLLTEEEYNAKAHEILERRVADDRKAYEQMAANRLKLSRKALDQQLTLLRVSRYQEGLTEREYAERVLQLRKEFLDRAMADEQITEEDRNQLRKEREELEEESNEKQLEYYQERFDKMTELASQLSQDLGDLISDLMKGEKDAWKDFLKGILKDLVNAVKKMVIAYIAELSVKNIAKYGIVKGLAISAAETVAVEVAASALNGVISGFASGGYTGDGRPDEPRGIVHANEFVANRYALANDAVRPVLDLIDQAQRTGTIANLTAADIAAATRPSSLPSSPSTHPTSSAPPAVSVPAGFPGRYPSPRDPELTAALHLLTRTTARAAEAYRTPSPIS